MLTFQRKQRHLFDMECSTTITLFGPNYFQGDHENITETGCVHRNTLGTSDISNNLDNKNVNKFV